MKDFARPSQSQIPAGPGVNAYDVLYPSSLGRRILGPARQEHNLFVALDSHCRFLPAFRWADGADYGRPLVVV